MDQYPAEIDSFMVGIAGDTLTKTNNRCINTDVLYSEAPDRTIVHTQENTQVNNVVIIILGMYAFIRGYVFLYDNLTLSKLDRLFNIHLHTCNHHNVRCLDN